MRQRRGRMAARCAGSCQPTWQGGLLACRGIAAAAPLRCLCAADAFTNCVCVERFAVAVPCLVARAHRRRNGRRRRVARRQRVFGTACWRSCGSGARRHSSSMRRWRVGVCYPIPAQKAACSISSTENALARIGLRSVRRAVCSIARLCSIVSGACVPTHLNESA